jgi:hypothetical protein
MPASATKKELFSYKRDENGHLMCDRCSFKPKATPTHPNGNPSTLHYHMKKHEGDFAFVCQVCSHGFLHKVSLDTHMASRHPESVQQKTIEMYSCCADDCDFTSLTKSNLIIHFMRKHCGDEVKKCMKHVEVENKKEIQCTCCSQNFKSGTAFHYHVAKCFQAHEIQTHPQLKEICAL